MRKAIQLVVVMGLSGWLCGLAFAQNPGLEFHQYLKENPGVRSDLNKNSSLIENSGYLHAHPSLQNFLHAHPEVERQVRQNPNGFVQLAVLGGFGAFHEFLQAHPDVRSELEANPNIARRPDFAKRHPSLREFFKKHPEVESELRDNPQQVMSMEKGAFRYTSGEHHFDAYLDKHPDIERQLEQNPKLARNATFLNSHPGFKQYLEQHPDVREQLEGNPGVFMNGQRRLEQHGQ